MRLHFFNSAVIANSKMDYYGRYLGSIFFLVSYKVANGLLQTCRLVLYGFDSYVMLIQGSLTNDEGDSYENVTQNENSHCLKLYRGYSNCWQILSEFNSKGLHQSSGKEKESCCLVFPSSTKREIRHFHVVVVQRRLRNVQKSVMHVQSCCFANINLLLFCRSRCGRRHRFLSSLLRARQLYTAATTRVMWLRSCVRYRWLIQGRGLGFPPPLILRPN